MAEFKLGRIRFVWRGAWTPGETYLVDDVISSGGKSYICVVNHTSASLFETDLQVIPSKWNIVSDGVRWRGDWEPNTYYNPGGLVKYGGYIYHCNTSHTSATYEAPTYLGLEDDQSKWDIFATSFNWLGAWTPGTRYKLNDFVTYGGVTYVCSDPHISAATDELGLEEDDDKWDVFNQGLTYLGTWTDVGGVRYKENDLVSYGANVWICTTPHTSTDDWLVDVTNWDIFLKGFEFEDSWNSTAEYQIGDTVTYGGYSYIAKTNHINKVPTSYPADWDVFTTGFNFRGDYLSAEDYLVGDVVRYGGYTYLAVADSTGQALTNSAYWSRLNYGLRWTNNSTTYNALAGVNVESSGSSALFDVVRSNSVYTVSIDTAGTGYTVGDTIKVLGSDLGGISPANDLFIEVTAITGPGPTGPISTVSTSGVAVTWKSGVTYLPGDLALFGPTTYICVLQHTASTPTRPDNDDSGTYWNVLAQGAESAILTTDGDMLYYGQNGPTRLPIGTDGQLLKVVAGYPTWQYYGLINNIVYVAPEGVDTVVESRGLTIDKPWKTVRFAAEEIEKGHLRRDSRELLQKNKQFIMKEISNWVIYTYSVTVTASDSGSDAFTCNDTSNLIANMPFEFQGTVFGGVSTGTTYYIKEVLDSTTFTISETSGGGVFALTTATGSMIGTLSYDYDFCERDTGLIVEALAYDISHDGNEEMTLCAQAYYSESGYDYINSNFGAQIQQTTSAYTYMKELVLDVLNNRAPDVNYQLLNSVGDSAQQYINADLGIEEDVETLATNLIDIVIDGINAGSVTAIKSSVKGQVTISVKTGTYFETLPIVVPKNCAIVGDELRSTVVSPAPAVPLLANDKEKSISALERIKDLAVDLMENVEVTPTSGNTKQQVYTTFETTESSNSVNRNSRTISEILEYGLGSVPEFTFTDPTGYDSGYFNARRLLRLNKEFVKAEITAWIAVQVAGAISPFSGSFTYDEEACARDVGYILDALEYDLTYGGNLETLVVARAYFVNGTPVYGSGEKEETLAAYAYLKSIIDDVVEAVAITPSAGNTETQITTGTAGSSAAGIFAGDRVQEIYDAIDLDGDTLDLSYPAEIAPDTSWVDANKLRFNSLVLADKATIQSDAVAWVQATYPDLTFNTATCSRDVGYIVDALRYDFMFGSNFRSVKAGMSYRRGITSTAVVLEDQLSPTIGIVKFIRDAVKYHTGGRSTLETNYTVADDILANGLTSVPGSFSYTDPTSYDTGFFNARRLISLNKEFIKAEITAWIAVQVAGNISPFTTLFTYDSAACARDVGYVVDALIYDLTYGGNLETIVAARAYYSGMSATFGAGEKEETLAAYAYLKSIIDNIATGSAIVKSSGNAETQTTSGTAGSSEAGIFAQDRIQDIYDTIDSDGTLPELIEPSTAWADSRLVDAFDEIQNQRTAIQEGAINYINEKYPAFSYNETTCSRDVGYIVDAFAYDLMFGSNFRSIKAAMSYYRGITSTEEVIDNQLPQTLDTLEYIYLELDKIVKGSYGDIGSLKAVARAEAAGNVMYDVLNNGLGSDPLLLLPNPIGFDVGYENARIQLVQNYAFIKADVTQYLVNNYTATWSGLGAAGQAACQRDIEYILDAIRYDLTYGGNTQTLIAGRSYYSYLDLVISPAAEVTATLAAYTHLKSIIDDVVRKLAVTPQAGNTTPQVTSGTGGSAGAGTFAQDRVQDIMDWISNGSSPTAIDPDNTWVDDDLVAAFNELQSRKEEIKLDAIGWVKKFYQYLNFNEATCSRDVGYIVDAFAYDIMFGSNFASTKAALSYYRATESAQEVITNQKAASLGLIKFLKYKVKSVVATGAAAQVHSAIDDIVGYIRGGAVPRFLWPDYTGIDSNRALARTLIWDNKEFVKAETIAYISENYPGLDYDSEVCARDVGYLIDALRYDLTFEGNSQTVAAAEAYYSYGTILQIPSGQLAATLDAFTHIKSILATITVNSSVTSLQTVVKQVFGDAGASVGTVTIVEGLMDDFIDIVGDTATPVVTDPDTSWVDADLLTQQSNLQSSKSSLVDAVTNYIGLNYPNLTYDIATCERDVELIIDAVGWDLVLNSNYQSVKAGMSYYRAAASVAVGVEQKEATLQAYRFLKWEMVDVVTLDETAVVRVKERMTEIINIIDKGIGETPEINGTNAYRNSLATFNGTRILDLNRDFLTKEASAWIAQTYSASVIDANSTGNVLTTSEPHNFTVGDPIRFTGVVFGGVFTGTTYFVRTTPSSTTFTLTETQGSSTATLISTASGTMTATYYFDEVKCQRDTSAYIDALIYDLHYAGNYKSLTAANLYNNAVSGSQLSNMYLTRNGCGIRNQTVVGLNGILGETNEFGTQRPTAGAYVSLDPGYGPNDFKSWVTTKSCYVQNVTTFGNGCVGNKIDGALHLGGNKSMVSNDFTQVLSDGIGVWCTGSGSLTELVSVFSYYGYAGYLAEFGGRIRATNGNSSYGTYGVIAEGTDTYEQPINATVDNRYFEAQITNTVTDAENEVLRLEFGNAGSGYTNTVYTISGAGFNATAVGDEIRDGAVFETRLIDLNDTNGVGGTSYVTAANAAQAGETGIITIANTDTALSGAYVGMRIQLTAGTGVGQYANILSYNNGTKEAVVTKDSFAPITATNTTSGTNLITVSSTVNFYTNMPIVFSGTTFGGVTENEIYYVRSGFTATQFTISTTSGGGAVTLSTASGSMTVYEAGWDHVVAGETVVNALDLTTAYIIEPRIQYSAPGYTASAKTLTNASWADITYGDNRFVAIANGSTNTNFSADGNSWGNAGALIDSTQGSVIFGGGQGARAYAVVGGLGGQGAEFEAILGEANTTGAPTADQVASVRIINGGQGYTTPPVIEFTPVAGGSGARATCTVLNGAVASVTVTIPGSGYNVPPTVSAETDRVTDIVVESWGINYNSATTTITLLGGGYSTIATCQPVISSNGGITNIRLIDSNLKVEGVDTDYLGYSGLGYTSTPSVIISDSNSKFLSISRTSNTSCYQTSSALGSAWTAGGNLPTTTWSGVAYGVVSGTPIFVAVGSTANAASTGDGTSWTGRTIPTLGAGTYSDVVFGNGTFVAISTGNNATAISSNGTTWTAGGNLPSSTTWVSVAYGNGRFVAIASGGRSVAYSIDKGANWTAAPVGLPASLTWTKVAYGQGLFMAIATGTNQCATSPDGINWTARTLTSSTTWNALAFGNPSSKTTWVAASQNSAGVLIRTGATAQGRMKVASGTVTEVRMVEPGSGYPTGTVTNTTTSTNLITVDATTNLVDGQPIEFFGTSAGGITTGETYYVIGSTITSTQFKVGTRAAPTTPITLSTETISGMTYRAGPIVTQTDPNKVKTAALRVRLGDGALGNPSFSNRGAENTTATTVTAGDGYADLYQPGQFINVAGLYEIPLPGCNVVFDSIPGQYFKLVAVTNVLGVAGNYTAQFQINPDISVFQAPAHNDPITTTLLYSQVRLTGHDFLYIGTGNFAETNYPNVDISTAIQANQTNATGGGRVFFTSTDQDGNFNVGNLFGVQQATGTATLNASAFNLSGLQSLQLGSVAIGVGSAVINQFSTDPFFTADSDNIVPTQRAIRAYITSQIGGGASSLNVNTLTSGVVFIAGNSITTTTGVALQINAKMNFTGGIDGAPVALGFFLQR